MKDIYSHKVDFLLSQYQLQTLFSLCNITYFAETKHGEMNNMITDEKKRCHFTPFYFYRAFCNTTEFASGQDGQILPARDFPRLSRKKMFLTTK